jgi:hypothetical protein
MQLINAILLIFYCLHESQVHLIYAHRFYSRKFSTVKCFNEC